MTDSISIPIPKSLLEKITKSGGSLYPLRGMDRKCIPTGIHALDLSIGGGIPTGSHIMLWGPKFGGKTLLAQLIARAWQHRCRYDGLLMSPRGYPISTPMGEKAQYFSEKTGEEVDESEATVLSIAADEEGAKTVPQRKVKAGYTMTPAAAPCRVLYVDLEGGIDRSWAESLGLDVDATHVYAPPSADDAIDVVRELLRAEAYELIIIDSLAALCPEAEQEADTGKSLPGLQARFASKAFRTLTAEMTRVRKDGAIQPTIVWINQVRIDLTQMYGDKRIKPGGKAQDFFAWLELFLSPASAEDRDFVSETDGGHKKVHRVNVEVKKNRSGFAGATTQFLIATVEADGNHRGAVVQVAQSCKTLRAYGVLKGVGKDGKAPYVLSAPYGIGEVRFQVLDDIHKWAQSTAPELFDITMQAFVAARVQQLRGESLADKLRKAADEKAVSAKAGVVETHGVGSGSEKLGSGSEKLGSGSPTEARGAASSPEEPPPPTPATSKPVSVRVAAPKQAK